jgi:hypothetical protein
VKLRILILTVVASLALGAAAAPSDATHLKLHPCRGMQTRTLRVTDISTNYRCHHTRAILRDLLRHGVRGLPTGPTPPGNWSCGKAGPNHICIRRYKSATTAPGQIVFRTSPLR